MNQSRRTYLIFILILSGIWFAWSSSRTSREDFGNALNHPTKCFDCEKQYTPQYAWVGQATKCFSCEQQALRMSGGDASAVFNEHPIKYHESPPIPGMGFAKMGSLR